MTTMTTAKIRRNGKRFGYPKCCVDFFLRFITWPQDRKDRYFQRRMNQTLGYVPCPRCAPAVKAAMSALKREMRHIIR